MDSRALALLQSVRSARMAGWKGLKSVTIKIVKTRMDVLTPAKLKMDSHARTSILQFALSVKNLSKQLSMLRAPKQQQQ